MRAEPVHLKKARIQQSIFTYEQRKLTKAGRNKLKSYRKSLKILQAGQDKATALGKAIHEFTGTSIVSSSLLTQSRRDAKVRIAISMFCKYGLENKIPLRFLMWYLDKSSDRAIYGARRKYNKLIIENKAEMKRYKQFCDNYLNSK